MFTKLVNLIIAICAVLTSIFDRKIKSEKKREIVKKVEDDKLLADAIRNGDTKTVARLIRKHTDYKGLKNAKIK